MSVPPAVAVCIATIVTRRRAVRATPRTAFQVMFRTMRRCFLAALALFALLSLTGAPVAAAMAEVAGVSLLVLSLIGGHR